MNFYSLCIDHNDSLFDHKETIVDDKVGIHAMEILKELIGFCDQKFNKKNPIQVYETLVNDLEKEIYCPFAYGYTNYSRKGYANNILTFGNVIHGPSGKSLRTVVGGAGNALSNNCGEKDAALNYIQYNMSAQCQSTVYFDNGGQPGRRQAWHNLDTNKNYSNFFLNTIETIDNSYMRSRYNGYMHLQDNGCMILHEYLLNNSPSKEAFDKINRCYKESQIDT
jgi:multiple sugar transport system substrate-binding protein